MSSYNEEQIRDSAQPIIDELEDLLKWRWEDNKDMLLSEFAIGKSEAILPVLDQHFTHQWDKNSSKYAPPNLKNELKGLIKLSKDQQVFTTPPQNNKPTLVALWWPWGHGSTVSLRLTMISEPYEYIEPNFSKNPIVRLFQKAKRSVA